MLEKVQNSGKVAVAVAVAVLVSCVTAYGQATEESYLTGMANFNRGNYDKAAESFTIAISRNNAYENLFVRRGDCYLKLKDPESAIRDFNEANEILPNVADLWLARAYSLSDNTAKAVLFLESHLGSPYRVAEDSIKKDPAFDGLQTSQEWYMLWQKEWYSDEEKAVADVRYYMKKGLPDQAISLLDNEIVKSPSSAGLLTMRGEVNFRKGNYAAAIADITAALTLQKNSTRTKPSPQAGAEAGIVLRAASYLKATRYKDAVSDFTKVLKDDPANFPAYLQRAQANAGLQNWEAAIRDVQTYLRYFNDDAGAVFQCGTYYFDSEDYMNALKCFNKNLKQDPNNSNYYKARGMTYTKTATYRYAVSDLSMALDLDPDDAETWMYLGVAKIRTGDNVNGCSDLEKARQMGSTEAVKYMLENCK